MSGYDSALTSKKSTDKKLVLETECNSISMAVTTKCTRNVRKVRDNSVSVGKGHGLKSDCLKYHLQSKGCMPWRAQVEVLHPYI